MRPLERAAAIVLPRTMIGFVYLFAGVHKLADPGAIEFGRRLAASDPSQLVPDPLGLTAGTVTPFVEIALGGLLLLGWRTRLALRCLAVLLVAITVAYGVAGLLDSMGPTAMDIRVVNFYILPRAALVIVTLFLPAADDLLSLDAVIDGRVRHLLGARL